MSRPVSIGAEPLIHVRDVCKTFGANRALDHVSLQIHPGEVVALLGANGAGKSTLVKILAGSQVPDEGELWVSGQRQHFASPLSARRVGVVAVHQQVNDGIVPGLSVAENLLLDELCQPDTGLWFNRKHLLQRAAIIAAGLGLDLPLQLAVERLGQAERQLVVLARAFALQPKLLILDEPTAALSDVEAQRLFGLIDTLRSRGVAILYISHRLSDLQRVADRAVVLRDGRLAGEFSARQLPAAVEAMLGSALDSYVHEPVVPGHEVLALRGAQVSARSAAFDLSLYEGEVVVLTGLLGAGKTEIAELLFGLRQPAAGTLQLDGQRWQPRSPRQAIACGVFFAAEDRASHSLIADFSLRKTLTLPFLERFTRGGFIRHQAEARAVQAQVAALGIKTAGIDLPMSALSGGNQQKVILGRWLMGDGRVLILDEPFQGVDVRARRDIGQLLRRSAAGRGTLVLCADVDEALEIADRVLVVRDFSIVAEYARADLTRAALVAALLEEPEPSRIPTSPRSRASA
ncbi:sugar ABC transporter ATP-binding protein [Pseudomonas costantinii]|uniref:Monosaccharide ABC transporter ATP-binding protein, CUT2 family n=1 Tax=Pseudomonas costantinii TaxID=168469 RepID=A0A1S2ULW3_9PSED|nr:sugar ABC transporter ATP-binding protein [Pseudomonas costantinii]NVZ18947.1 sugar ABC transporter ATP-binding protein [Pseudomonas costantinii]OIN47377.1 sugar ABC transporter [Pseudomonas costantinii]SEE45209.1 monosaccharide ABC transporter ATP-binding protein, CUT2 family [Pseudomonas costantinii]